MPIIGIQGYSKSGKDTVAKMIQYLDWKNQIELGLKQIANYNLSDFLNNDIGNSQSKWYKTSFAERPKDLYSSIVGHRGIFLDLTKESCRSQFVEFCEYSKKTFGNFIWIANLIRNIAHKENIIISDLRFLNEYEYLKNNAIFIKVVNDKVKPYNNQEVELDNEHFDYVIENNSDIETLLQNVEIVYNKIIGNEN